MYTKEQVREAIENCLTKNEQEIIIARFGLNDGIPWTLSEIRKTLG